MAYAEGGLVDALSAVTGFAPVPVAAIGMLLFLAWLTARFSVYAITNRRLILRIGIALPLTINLPFGSIQSAALKLFADGCGDIPILLRDGAPFGYVVLWPHARPWRVRRPEPMLRAVPDAEHVARLLAAAVSANQADVNTEAPARNRAKIPASPLATASR
jgi:hypothetical protein